MQLMNQIVDGVDNGFAEWLKVVSYQA